jgi:sugar phosphate permease
LYGVFGPFWAIAIDLAPPTARGVFTGSVNCCGQIGAFSSQIIIGLLANQMKSFTGAILFMIAALTLGAVVMSVLQRLQQSSQAKAFV